MHILKLKIIKDLSTNDSYRAVNFSSQAELGQTWDHLINLTEKIA
jgi:hypothetical protein